MRSSVFLEKKRGLYQMGNCICEKDWECMIPNVAFNTQILGV